MSTASAKSAAALGFLTVHECASRGLFGGYLILNRSGRPLQFHCTAPVKPNRAQEILYGATLAPYLYGEQIGHSLVSQAKEKPALICTDCSEMLSLSSMVKQPVVLVEQALQDRNDTLTKSDGKQIRVDAAHDGSGSPAMFSVGAHRVALAAESAGHESEVTQQLNNLGDNFDLAEPFERIRQAIAEAGGGR